MRRFALGLVVASLVAGCATGRYQPVPDTYTGPLARLSDTAVLEGAEKAQLFALAQVDGNDVDNSFAATERASLGVGKGMVTRVVARKLPARKMRVRLHGGPATVAGKPISALPDIDGEVDFAPEEGRTYLVTGTLKAGDSSVWIIDEESRAPVTEKIVRR